MLSDVRSIVDNATHLCPPERAQIGQGKLKPHRWSIFDCAVADFGLERITESMRIEPALYLFAIHLELLIGKNW